MGSFGKHMNSWAGSSAGSWIEVGIEVSTSMLAASIIALSSDSMAAISDIVAARSDIRLEDSRLKK